MNTLHVKDPHIDEVLILQRLLNKTGYALAADGNFGPQTLRQVRQFQTDQDLQIDGVVGPGTWYALFHHDLVVGQPVFGFDLSVYDLGKLIDWAGALNDPQHFFYFCYTRITRGTSYADPSAPTFWVQMKDAAIVRGVYHFLTYRPDSDPVLQASNFLNNSLSAGVVFGEPGVLPPVVDVEPEKQNSQEEDYMRQNKDVVLSNLKTWLDMVESKTGVVPTIYSSKKNWDTILGSPTGFERYPLWVANYKDPSLQPLLPVSWNDYTVWQYSEGGKIPGANIEDFDLNIYKGNMQSLLNFAGYDAAVLQDSVVAERPAFMVIKDYTTIHFS